MKKMMCLFALSGIFSLRGMLDPRAALELRIRQERDERPEVMLRAVNCDCAQAQLLLFGTICNQEPESVELMKILVMNGVNVQDRLEMGGSTPYQLLLDSYLPIWLKIRKMDVLIGGGMRVDFDYFAQWRANEESFGRPSEDFERLEQAMRTAVAQRRAE